MRTQLRFLPATLALVIASQLSGWAMPAGSASSPLGVVLEADHALVGTDPAASGATVFDGEPLRTDNSGSLRVRLGGSLAYLLPKTSAVVHQATPGFSASLLQGTMVLSSAAAESFNLRADGAVIRPGTPGIPTVAQVTIVNPNELLLTSRKGTLEVSMEDEVKVVPEGATYRMLIQPQPAAAPAAAPAPAPSSQGPVATGRNHFIFIVAAVAVGGTVAGVLLATESPSKP